MSWKTIIPLLVVVVLVVAFIAFRGGSPVTTDLSRGGALGEAPESEALGDTLRQLEGIIVEEDAAFAASADAAEAGLDFSSDLTELENAATL